MPTSTTFWSNPSLDPKRQYRFLVQFGNISAPVFVAKTVKKPSFVVGTSKHQFLSHEFKFPTTVKWNDIQITIVDPGQPDMTKSLMAVLATAGYNYPSVGAANQTPGSDITKTVSKEKYVGSTGDAGAVGFIKIQQINADGQIMESWELKNAWISNVEFGQLSYASEDVVDITMTVVYDWALLNQGDVQAPSAFASSVNKKLPKE